MQHVQIELFPPKPVNSLTSSGLSSSVDEL
jgi:hypothetical protein